MIKAWLLEVEYKNKIDKIVILKEFYLSRRVAYSRLNALVQKLQVSKASVKQEYYYGKVN